MLDWTAFAVGLAGYMVYVIDIIRGRARPDRLAWGIWTFIYAITTFALGAHGITFVAMLAGVQWAGVLVIFLMSLWRGQGEMTPGAALTVLSVMLGRIVWWESGSAVVALVVCLGIETLGIVRVAVAVARDPKCETYFMWLTAGMYGLLAMVDLAARPGSRPLDYLYPGVLLLNFAVVMTKLMRTPRRQQPRVTSFA